MRIISALVDAPGDAVAHELVQRLWEIAVQRLKVLISFGPADPPLYRAAASEHASDAEGGTALPNTIITPHIAYDTREAICRISDITLDNIRRWLRDHDQK